MNNLKFFIAALIIFCLSNGEVNGTIHWDAENTVPHTEDIVELPEISPEYHFSNITNPDQLIGLIEECELRKENAHLMAQGARNLGYKEEHPIIQTAKHDWERANLFQQKYQEALNRLIEKKKIEQGAQHPVATEIWYYLSDLGYNKYVCAGILGNMMVEAGGHTLQIIPDIYNPTGQFYGICQWSKTYYAEIHGAPLDTQLNFLRDNIEFEFEGFAYFYKKDFSYEEFLKMKDEQAAALAFCKVYERCPPDSYNARQQCATEALEFFTK